jgi:hypothetical protein
VIDEGATTCIMSMNCWKSLGSPQLTTLETILKAFDGHFFKPHGIFPSLPIELAGKTASVEVEVIDANLDYNILLGRTWFYAMKAVTSSIFQIIHFPHQGKIVTIDQLDYCTPDVRLNPNTNVPFVGELAPEYESIGVGLYPTLMGTFPLPPPDISQIALINMISSFCGKSLGSFDPWVIPHSSDVESFRATMPLSPTELSYSAI